VTGDKREHHLLDRPRDAPTRTAFGVMAITFYLVLFINGGNDIIAYTFHSEINLITRISQVLLIVAPPISFIITKRVCLGLQRKDLQRVLHGRETGIIKRLPNGEFIEVHTPISNEHRYTLLQRNTYTPLDQRPADEHGIPAPENLGKMRARISRFWYADELPKPTAEEIQHELSHGGHH
jgi:ubiquinol-cytochrome c reductase cytochrome b subunit